MPAFWLDSVRDRLFPQVHFVPDAGDGGGGSAEGGDPDGDGGNAGDERKYTDADMKAAVKKRLAKKEAETKALKDQIAAHDATIADLNAKIEVIGDGTLDADAKKRLGTLEVDKKRTEAQINELSASNKQLTEKLEAENSRRLSMERDSMLESALNKVGCIDVPKGKRLFRDSCVYDAEEETWLFTTESDNTVTIETGIAAELPDYMRTATARGGSGAQGGTIKQNRGAKALETLEKEYDAARRKVANNSRDNAALTAMSRLKRQIDALKKQKV